MRKFYMAASYTNRRSMQEMVEQIESLCRWKCNARWLREDGWEERPQAECIKADLADIRDADVLVMNLIPLASPSKHIEFGYALASRKPTLLVGTEVKGSVFFACRNVEWIPAEGGAQAVASWLKRIEGSLGKRDKLFPTRVRYNASRDMGKSFYTLIFGEGIDMQHIDLPVHKLEQEEQDILRSLWLQTELGG